MRLAGLTLHIRRIVVDERYRTSATQLSDAIGQALQAELTQKPGNSHATRGQPGIAAVIASQIGQRLPMSAATRPAPNPSPRQFRSGAPR